MRSGIQRYELTARLATGEHADLLRGVATTRDGEKIGVVVHWISPDLSADDLYQTRFWNEARVGAAIDHPNVVELVGAGHLDGRLFAAYRYVDGADLERVLRRVYAAGRRLTVAAALHIACEVLKGLQQLHSLRDGEGASLRIAHGSLTPKKVIASRDGKIRLASIGLALPKKVKADVRGDLQAVGALLYVLLTGPGVRGTIDEARPDLGAPLRSSIDRALAGDPGFGSAQEMHLELLQFANDSRLKLGGEKLAQFLAAHFPGGSPDAELAPDEASFSSTTFEATETDDAPPAEGWAPLAETHYVSKSRRPARAEPVKSERPTVLRDDPTGEVRASRRRTTAIRHKDDLAPAEAPRPRKPKASRVRSPRRPAATRPRGGELASGEADGGEPIPRAPAPTSTRVSPPPDPEPEPEIRRSGRDPIVAKPAPTRTKVSADPPTKEVPAAEPHTKEFPPPEPPPPDPPRTPDGSRSPTRIGVGATRDELSDSFPAAPRPDRTADAISDSHPAARRGADAISDSFPSADRRADAISGLVPAAPAKSGDEPSDSHPAANAPPPKRREPPPPIAPRPHPVESPAPAMTPSGRKGPVIAPAISPERAILPASGDIAAVTWLEGHGQAVGAIAVAPDGKRALSGASDKSLIVWNVRARSLERRLEGHDGSVLAVAISGDSGTALSAGRDKKLHAWDLQSGLSVATMTGHKGWVFSVALSHDGALAVSAGIDTTVRVWKLPDGAPAGVLKGHDDAVTQIALLPDGRALSGSRDGTLRIWDLASHKDVSRIAGLVDSVRALAVSPDGTRAAVAGSDPVLRLVDLESRKEIARCEGHSAAIASAAFSADGRLAASASYDGTIRVWNVETGKTASVHDGHGEAVLAIAFLPDGRLLSGGADHRVGLWR